MKTFAFSLGIIPVQEFIMEARRSRDLRAGSAMLSWVALQIYKQLKTGLPPLKVLKPDTFDRQGLKVTFETMVTDASYSLPNRFSGYVEAADIDQCAGAFKAVQGTGLEDIWQDMVGIAISKKNLERANIDGGARQKIEGYLSSVACPFHVVWVLKEVTGEADPEKDMDDINRDFADVKKARPIFAAEGDRRVVKCDQCGKRNSFLPGENYAAWKDSFDDFVGAAWVQKEHRIEPSERLCGVCAIKRFTGYVTPKTDNSDSTILSTNDIAAAAWIKMVEKLPEFKDLDAFIKKQKFDDPVRLYFEGRIDQQRDKLDQDSRDKLEDLKNGLAAGIRRAEVAVKPVPTNYLAAIAFDGDNIGSAKIDDIGKRLETFTEDIAGLIRGNQASAFYLGGDEGIILCPLDNCLNLTSEINVLFRKCMKDTGVTLSAGISVFDRQRPMGGGIERAFAALEKAKKSGKNALGIILQTTSGNEFDWVAEWDSKAHQQLSNGVEALRSGRLSMGWSSELEQLVLETAVEWTNNRFLQALQDEISRITARKTPQQETAGAGKKIWEGDKFFDSQTSSEQLLAQLHAAAFLVRNSFLKPANNIETGEVTQ